MRNQQIDRCFQSYAKGRISVEMRIFFFWKIFVNYLTVVGFDQIHLVQLKLDVIDVLSQIIY